MQGAADKEKSSPTTLTDLMRVRFKGILDPVGRLFNSLGLMPNTMTILGLFGTTVGAYSIMRGEMVIGGVILLLMGPIDALDGTMARLRGEPSAFGAFVDSVTDRYSELVVMGAFILHYSQENYWLGVVLAYLAAAGSVLVSYTRARAQSLGVDSKVGLLTRMERYLVLAPSLILNVPIIGLWILAIFANLTAVQRIYDVRRQFRARRETGKEK